MYTIIARPDGKFDCQGRLQDGTEHWTANTLDEAIASMKQFAKHMNGSKLKKRHITFLKPLQVVKTEYVEWQPFGERR